MKSKRFISTTLIASFIVLVTTGFAYANSMMITAGSTFPYFQLGTLVMAGIIITSLHYRFNKILVSESVGAFALYAIMISLFTEPVFTALKSLVM